MVASPFENHSLKLNACMHCLKMSDMKLIPVMFTVNFEG